MRRTFLGLAGAGLLVAALATATPAHAQSASAVGTVDMGRINEEYQAIKQLTAQYQAFYQEQQSKLEERAKTRMLKDAEVQEFTGLSQFGAPTDANKQRLAELAELSNTRERRLTELQQKTRDAAEQKEFDELNAIATARSAELKKLEDDLWQTVSAKREELLKAINDSVNVAIKLVAEQKKLSVVVAKSALVGDAGAAPIVLYGGADITDDVLAKLNTAPAPVVGSTPAPTAAQPAPPAAGQSATPAAGQPTAPAAGAPATPK